MPRNPEAAERDDPSISIVFEMVKAAIDLQFKIAERIDAKIRAYFGFAATIYAVAQAIVLKNDVHTRLGSKAGTVSGLAIAATALLVVALFTAVSALRTMDEQDVSEENLRKLLRRAYTGDRKAGSEGVNLLIGQLNRRKATNKVREHRLWAVIITVAAATLIAILEVALAVEAVT